MSLRIAIASSAVCIAGAYFYTTYLHRSLASQIRHKDIPSDEREGFHAAGHLESIPEELLAHPDKFRIKHEIDETSCKITFPESEAEAQRLFTKLLRRNMSLFSRTPQSYILRLMAKSPEQTQSFTVAHIQALDFKPGDLCCGFNRVLTRNAAKVEIELVAPPSMEGMNGRLILSLAPQGNAAVLRTETLQWIEVGNATVLPLERAAARFMHEMASWWLLVTGAKYLEDLKQSSGS